MLERPWLLYTARVSHAGGGNGNDGQRWLIYFPSLDLGLIVDILRSLQGSVSYIVVSRGKWSVAAVQ